MKVFFSLSFVPLLLIGCAGNVKDFACTGQNWTEFGYKMGSEGKSVHEFDAHRSACGANLEKGALRAYLDGYTLGIMDFCTYNNGYMIGAKNQPLNEHCPTEVRAEFVKGYNLGKIEVAAKVQQMKRDSEDLESKQIKEAAEISANKGMSGRGGSN